MTEGYRSATPYCAANKTKKPVCKSTQGDISRYHLYSQSKSFASFSLSRANTATATTISPPQLPSETAIPLRLCAFQPTDAISEKTKIEERQLVLSFFKLFSLYLFNRYLSIILFLFFSFSLMYLFLRSALRSFLEPSKRPFPPLRGPSCTKFAQRSTTPFSTRYRSALHAT